MPTRVQRQRTKGWRMPPETKCVDRSTEHWGNPYEVYSWYPLSWFPPHLWRQTKTTDTGHVFGKVMNAEHAVELYRWWLAKPDQTSLVKLARSALRGKNLACWCPPQSACHADVLLEIANAN